MPTTKVMIIRHAEKPSDDGSVHGVSENGQVDAEDLAVKGWQRAGALVRFFAPFEGQFAHRLLATPDVIFASGTGQHSNSLRPQHTVVPLAQFLNRPLNLNHLKGEETALAADVAETNGIVLISWEHLVIPDIVHLIAGPGVNCPDKWPGSRFDVVWVLDRQQGAGWNFAQVPQLLLPGDLPKAIGE